MMPIEMTSSAQQDESAVAAVRRGDAERYRELVERHERRVFAVAWSRLGDAALAEEAAQEAFIRGYRRLWLLGDGAKFAAWITTIARHAAINLGLRHRRELNKRERWALEQPATASPTAGETTELCPPETLRQTLAELPAAHRECLVLFYLEGKSGAEAAATLGISEVALRVRLHRARAALRERLEEKLEGSLANLRPAKTLVPAVMATILTSSPAKLIGGGVGAKILSYLLPFKFFFLFMWAIAILPNLLLGLITARLEHANLRDPEGFRARMYRKSRKRMFLVLPLLLAAPLLIPYFYLVILSPRFGINSFFLLLAVFLLPAIFFSARQFVINRTRYHVTTFLSLLIMIPGWLAIGLGWLPVSANSTIMMFYILLFIIGFSSRPMRMDYNLFRRVLQKMLATAAAEKTSTETVFRLNKSQLLAFARFLGNRLLVVDYLWRGQGLILRLPALKTVSLLDALASFGFYSASGRRFSYLMLEWNGTVSAQLGVRDEAALRASEGRALSNAAALEKQVAVAVESAWRHFRNGDSALAERAVGQVPEADIFVVPPARSKAVRLQRGVMIFFLALMLVLNGLLFFRPAWMGGLKPVNVTEAEVRAFLGGITTNKNPIIHNTQRSYPGDPVVALDNCLVLPPTNLFSPDGLLAARQVVLRAAGFDPHGALESKLSSLEDAWLLEKAMMNGWISYADLGVTSAQAAAHLRSFPESPVWHFMRRMSLEDGKEMDVTRIDELPLAQLRWLREVNCVDMVDRKTILKQILPVQVLSGEASAARPPLRNWRDVRGLFYTPGFPALKDTYCDLAALEILGGLDKIDREACIKGILKRHQGKGYFTSPGGRNEEGIDGSARDTIAAFESLRILGALDRVKDLDKWQFRVKSDHLSKPDANGVRTLSWDGWQDVEAWVCQQRLEKILRERKENPTAPFRSLLEP
jgi:RNA polymerase sigma-70 factor (ECF subfamily)